MYNGGWRGKIHHIFIMNHMFTQTHIQHHVKPNLCLHQEHTFCSASIMNIKLHIFSKIPLFLHKAYIKLYTPNITLLISVPILLHYIHFNLVPCKSLLLLLCLVLKVVELKEKLGREGKHLTISTCPRLYIQKAKQTEIIIIIW